MFNHLNLSKRSENVVHSNKTTAKSWNFKRKKKTFINSTMERRQQARTARPLHLHIDDGRFILWLPTLAYKLCSNRVILKLQYAKLKSPEMEYIFSFLFN